MRKRISWWWWFRFSASCAAIWVYLTTVDPQGWAATWLGGIGAGVAVAICLDLCRAGYRHEQQARREREEAR